MVILDPRIDAYLATVPAFALPNLQRLRKDVHAARPDGVETIKWSRPHFMLDNKLLYGMSAFKTHCTFGFWEREGGGAAGGGQVAKLEVRGLLRPPPCLAAIHQAGATHCSLRPRMPARVSPRRHQPGRAGP